MDIPPGRYPIQFLLKPFEECRRLGLSSEREAQIRQAFPGGTNMLVATRVLREGPSEEKLEEGDILFSIRGELITEFNRMEDILDASVAKGIEFMVIRGGIDIKVDIVVGDLHTFTPDRVVHVAGAGFHELSYQQAMRYGVPRKGIFVCDAHGSFTSLQGGQRLINTIDGQDVPDLNTFISVMKAIPDKARVVVTYHSLSNIHALKTTIVYVDRHWTKDMTLAVRNDNTGLWDINELADPLPPVPLARQKASSFMRLEHIPHPAVADLVRSFVHVDCSCKTPIQPGNLEQLSSSGVGLVVDADKGIVVVSRAIVPSDLCDISVTIASSILVEAKILFLHPLQNYAVLQYDASTVDAPVLTARLSPVEISQGEPVYFVGYKELWGDRPRAHHHLSEISAGCASGLVLPRYKALNIDVLTVGTKLAEQCGSGVLVANDGTVRALWLTFPGEKTDKGISKPHHGLSTAILLPVITQIREGAYPKLRVLPAEFRPITLSDARLMGVTEEWIEKAAEANQHQHRLFKVERSYGMGEKERALLEGDVLLTLDKQLITKLSELDVMYSREMLEALVVRGRKELQIAPATLAANDVDTDRIVRFCGATIHQPDHSIRQERTKMYSEVYISYYTYGSPAQQYKLFPPSFITHVNGEPTPDLTSFLAAVLKIPDNTCKTLSPTASPPGDGYG